MAGLVLESPKSQNANKQSRLVTYNSLHLFIYIYIYIFILCTVYYCISKSTIRGLSIHIQALSRAFFVVYIYVITYN